jgi:hypothetical protein
VAPTRIWFRSSRRSTSGAVTRFSTTTNRTVPTIVIAKQPSVDADAQPQSEVPVGAVTTARSHRGPLDVVTRRG